jgi:ATP-dependent DNA helicase RecG
MMEEAKQLFKKLKIHTLLDLALIIPSSYNDTTLSTSLELGKTHTLEATVVDSSVYGGKLRVTFQLKLNGRRLSSTFFRVTPYHHKLFEVGSNHVIQGRLEEYKGYLQMSQPKSIKQIG